MPISSFPEPLFDLLLALQIAAGFIGLTTGGVNMVLRKGNARHRWVGRAFAVAMLCAAATAAALAGLRANPFLLTVRLLTAYLTLSGWWATPRLGPGRARRDAVLAAAGGATALAMLAAAWVGLRDAAWTETAVLGAFGLGLAATAWIDLRVALAGGGRPPRSAARATSSAWSAPGSPA